MTVQTYRKKPMTIEAIQWVGNNADAIYEWCVLPTGGPVRNAVMQCFVPLDSDEVFDVLDQDTLDRFVTVNGGTAALWVAANQSWLPILDGEWIAKDRHGFYPIKADVFAESYELSLT